MSSKKLYYVYILNNEEHPARHYTGFTENVRERLAHHNNGDCPHTTKFRPWYIKTCIAFSERERALEFERYLKSHAGRAFTVKHL